MRAKVRCIESFFDSQTATHYVVNHKVIEIDLRPEIEKFFKIIERKKEVTEDGK